mmetsp:Transcript_17912/g.28934  ORF Transcript_17912/g.28934 Transcript_17912/m.28934 type:complete len:92 (-) Transcript_17912:119-394(-)
MLCYATTIILIFISFIEMDFSRTIQYYGTNMHTDNSAVVFVNQKRKDPKDMLQGNCVMQPLVDPLSRNRVPHPEHRGLDQVAGIHQSILLL